MTTMTDKTEQLVEALREELKQYGELMAMLEQQQQLVIERNAEGIQAIAEKIDHESTILEQCKASREGIQKTIAKDLGLANDNDFQKIVPKLPDDYQPLVKALIEENNHSVMRIGRIAKQNHVLLSRSIEMVNSLIRNICPDVTPNIYDQRGGVMQQTVSVGPAVEHVC